MATDYTDRRHIQKENNYMKQLINKYNTEFHNEINARRELLRKQEQEQGDSHE